MALAYRTSVAFGNTVSGTNPSGAITPVVNDLFLVFCVANGNTNASPTCSDGNTGGTYSLLFTALKNSSADIISCFVRNNLVPNTTSTTVTVAIGAHSATEVVVVAVSGSLVAGTAAIVQNGSQANQAGSTTPAPAFGAGSGAGNLLLSFVGNGTNPGGVTTPAGWTRPQNVGQTACGLDVAYASPASTTTVTWGSTSASAFASGVIELTPVLAAGVNVSKLNAYAVLQPPAGISVTKLLAYAVLYSGNVTPPIWPSFSFADGVIGVPYSQAWDMPSSAQVVTYALYSGTLPPGLSITALTGNQAKLSGTPTTLGTYSFVLSATNTYGTANQSFSITINPVPSALAGGSFTFIN